jgi:segregation and condensation protein B
LNPDGTRAGDPEGAAPDPSPGPRPREARDPEAASPAESGEAPETRDLSNDHLRGLLEALVFASDKPVASGQLAKLTSAPLRHVKSLMGELKEHYARRGIVLLEMAGGWVFRTSAEYAPFVRELTSERPVKLTRAQIETLAIAAYRQPITRPEIDEIRGVDSGATLKLLLERDLVRILGKKDEPGRPLLYGTTGHFLEFFGLKSLRDLPTLREFTELSEDSQRTLEALPQGEAADTDATRLQILEPPLVSDLRDTECEPPVEPEAAAVPVGDDVDRTIPPADDEGVHDTLVPSAPPTGDDIEDPPDSEPPTIEER